MMMTQRTITDSDGTQWTFAQTLASASDTHAEAQSAEADADDAVVVVATPSGGAQSARLELPRDWDASMGDDELVALLERAR